jgi:hypothetical protein
VSSLNASLDLVLDIAGVEMTALIDFATGMVVASAGENSPVLPAVAATVAYEARSAVETYEQGTSRGELDEISVTTARRFQLMKVLEYQRGEGLLLYADVDLSRTNMALAALQIEQLSSGLLAR